MYTFEIFAIYENDFTERLNAANRKAEKNGLPKISAEIEHYRSEDGKMISRISIDETLSHFSGWTLTAVVDFVDGEVLVRTLPGQAVPQDFDAEPTRCDHCHIKHSRKVSYIIHDQTGEYMQVGASCLNDFLGEDSAVLVSYQWLVDYIAEYSEAVGDEGFVMGGGQLDLHAYLRFVQAAIKAYGWTSRSRANELGLPATADVANQMVGNKEIREDVFELAKNGRSLSYTIQEALDWAQEQGGNEYLDNIAAIARLDIVPAKYDGYAASILAAYERHLQSLEERKHLEESCKPAKAGRQVVVGRILAIKSVTGRYGVQIKVTIQTEDGWKLWTTLPVSISEATVGDTVQMSVTVSPSDRDEFFAFGKRPSKAIILS